MASLISLILLLIPSIQTTAGAPEPEYTIEAIRFGTIPQFRTASLAAPQSALPLTDAALVQSKLGMYADADETFKKSMALNPPPEIASAAAFGLAQLCRITGRLSDALRLAQSAAKLYPDEDRFWLELGDCYSEIGGHGAEARQAYLRALKDAEDKLKSSSDASTQMFLTLYQLKVGASRSTVDTIATAESIGATDADSRLCKLRILALTEQRDRALDTLADCLRSGVTIFQVDFTPDLQSLRKDSRYYKISKTRPR